MIGSGQTRSRCPAGCSRIAAARRCHWRGSLMACFSPGTVRGEARKGFAQLEVAVPSSREIRMESPGGTVGVIIGMDPHKRSATIEVIDERAVVLAAGRYGTDKAGYADMLAAGRKFADQVWAVEGCNGIGRHLAHRLVHDGETVSGVPPKLSAQVRVFATGNGRKTDPVDAHSVALAALRAPGLVQVRAWGRPGGDGHARRPPRRAWPGPHPGHRPAAPAPAGTAARRGQEVPVRPAGPRA